MAASDSKLIINLTSGTLVCEQVTVADRLGPRMRGLLGRRALPSGEGILLEPAPSIHTAFMRFAIDVVFMDASLRVVKLVDGLPPWRAASARRARFALELAAGEIARRAVAVADQLGVLDVGQAPPPAGSIQAGRAVAPVAAGKEGRDRQAGPGQSRSGPRARVLLVAQDRRYSAVSAALLMRRNCAVTLSDRQTSIPDLISRDATQVVVLDVGTSSPRAAREAAQLAAANPGVGIVLVADEPDETRYPLPVLPKWGSFDRLYAAIEDVCPAEADGADV